MEFHRVQNFVKSRFGKAPELSAECGDREILQGSYENYRQLARLSLKCQQKYLTIPVSSDDFRR